jgi:hypothetical protein
VNGDQRQSILVAALGALAGVAGTIAVFSGGWDSLATVTLAAVVAVATLTRVPVPFGGAVPLSYAVVIALAELRAPGDFAVIAGGGTAVALIAVAAHAGSGTAAPLATRLVLGLGIALVTAGAARGSTWGQDAGTLGRTLAIGVVVLTTDSVAARMLESAPRRLHYRPAGPVYLTLLCGAALIAVAYRDSGAWMATVAIVPLLLTRFSFERHAGAHETFSQTVQALGVVPELAGMAPLGHSERTAQYASRLAAELGFAHRDHDRIVLAARLHHLGAVSLDSHDPAEAPDPFDTARHGAALLREASFPADVAELIETAQAGTMEGACPTLPAAVIRVASAFDDLVGDDATRADQGLAIIASHPRDAHSRRAVAALFELMAADAALVHHAIEAGARFTEAAEGLDLEALARGQGGDLLPFARRRR